MDGESIKRLMRGFVWTSYNDRYSRLYNLTQLYNIIEIW